MKTNSKEFKKLQATWYGKLEKSGFDDIENKQGGLKTYVSQHAHHYHNQSQNLEAKIEYYRRATHFLHDYKFESALEKQIWFQHSEGVSARNISKLLKNKLGKTTVNDIIRRLAKLMLTLYKSDL